MLQIWVIIIIKLNRVFYFNCRFYNGTVESFDPVTRRHKVCTSIVIFLTFYSAAVWLSFLQVKILTFCIQFVVSGHCRFITRMVMLSCSFSMMSGGSLLKVAQQKKGWVLGLSVFSCYDLWTDFWFVYFLIRAKPKKLWVSKVLWRGKFFIQ